MSIEGLLEEPKYPTSKNKYVGIEIEFLIPKGQYEKLEDLLIKNDLQWNVHLGEDGSVKDVDFLPVMEMRPAPWDTRRMIEVITNKADCKDGHEIRILVQENEAPGIVTKVCEIIKECKGIVNHSCGLHVHIDLRTRDHNKVYNNMFRVQNLMFATQPISRRKGNQYCKKVAKMSKNPRKRYYAINRQAYNEHRTIEIRLHEASIDAKEILMWTGFLIEIANMDKVLTKNINKVKELSWLPERLKGHLNERIKKYSRKCHPKTA